MGSQSFLPAYWTCLFPPWRGHEKESAFSKGIRTTQVLMLLDSLLAPQIVAPLQIHKRARRKIAFFASFINRSGEPAMDCQALTDSINTTIRTVSLLEFRHKPWWWGNSFIKSVKICTGYCYRHDAMLSRSFPFLLFGSNYYDQSAQDLLLLSKPIRKENYEITTNCTNLTGSSWSRYFGVHNTSKNCKKTKNEGIVNSKIPAWSHLLRLGSSLATKHDWFIHSY